MSRESYISIKTGAPLSRDLQRLADDVAEFAVDVSCGLTAERTESRLEMLERRVRSCEGVARELEALVERGMEGRRGHG
jgi:hypothetical protein